MLMALFYKLLLVKNKEDFKVFIKIFIPRVLGSLIPIALLCMYLYFNNAIKDFVDYTINGVSTFSNYLSYITLYNLSLETKILCIAVPISFIVMFVLTVIRFPKKYWQKQLFIVFAYSLASFVVVFPISDRIHFFIGIVPCLCGIVYILELIFECIKTRLKYFDKIWIKKVTRIILSIVLILLTIKQIKQPIKNLNEYLHQIQSYNSLKHFKYLNVPDYIKQAVTEIDEYILEKQKSGQKVYILDASAAIYTIPIDQYNKDYDMFLKGNLGSKGEKGIIEKIKSSEKNVLYLITKDGVSRNWQNPEQVRAYIKENLNKVDEVGKFEVYTMK